MLFIIDEISKESKIVFPVPSQMKIGSLRRWIMLSWVVVVCFTITPGQDNSAFSDEGDQTREFRRLDLFPAISYSPETNLTLGAIGIYYFDLAKGNPQTPVSNLEFLGIYTLNRQIIFETRWEAFTTRSRWRTRGEAFYNRYPDRNYGMGNDAGTLVVEVDGEGVLDTLNYLNFNSDRIKVTPVVLRKIFPHTYFGLIYDIEYLYRMSILPERYYFLNTDSTEILSMPIDGIRSGIGWQMLYDSRDYILNPMKGSLVELQNLYYGSALGSDFRFQTIYLDARQYFNAFRNQTLALRLVGSFGFTSDEIPMRALSRVGGHKFLRGYFKGTYQDHHMTAFEVEYRLPLWSEGIDTKWWKVWKRLGLVGFIGGAQVFRKPSNFKGTEFNLAVGTGLRILFNPESRVNIRIDYAVGLSPGPEGHDKRQSGFYFYLGEAF